MIRGWLLNAVQRRMHGARGWIWVHVRRLALRYARVAFGRPRNRAGTSPKRNAMQWVEMGAVDNVCWLCQMND
jgi:hypothetical protein